MRRKELAHSFLIVQTHAYAHAARNLGITTSSASSVLVADADEVKRTHGSGNMAYCTSKNPSDCPHCEVICLQSLRSPGYPS